MVLRSVVRDLITIYLCYNVIRGYTSEGNFTLAAIVLLLLTFWFILEKIGILPKLGE